MSFLGGPVNQARKPFAEVLPDGRKRLTRYFKVGQTSSNIPVELDYAVKTPDPWTDAPTGWEGLLLTYKQMRESERGFPDGAEDSKPIVQLIFEQISDTGETQTGGTPLTQLPDGRDQVEFTYVMFSSSAYTPETPGTSTAPSPFTTYYLWEEENTDDGTLRNIKRTYQTAGIVARGSEILEGGKLLKQSITSFKTVPTTPTGFTLIGAPVQNPLGYPIYTYSYASADPAAGAGGETSRRFVDAQGGTTAFDPSSPTSGAGAVRCIITYLTSLSITTDPTTGPASFVRYAVDYVARDGYKEWTVQYGYGSGLIVDDSTIISASALVVYHRVQFGSAPSAPSATIGGTVTLFEDSVRNEDGYKVYERRWAEGDGQNSITTAGQSDGALDYTVTTFTLAGSTPAYPGSGTGYLIHLTQTAENAYFRNVAVWRKPPATITFRKMYKFLMPGVASISGSPILYNQDPPVTMELLASVEVSYGTSQITTTPFTVSQYARLNVQWIPYLNPGISPTPGTPPTDTRTGPPLGYSESLGLYLAGASGTSDTNNFFNGVFVATYEYTLSSSTPSTRPSGSTTLAVDNDPYLVNTSGTVVYRSMVTTYSF